MQPYLGLCLELSISRAIVYALEMVLPLSGPFCFFVLIVALRPKSTAMVMAGRSVHLTTLFPGQA